LEDEDDEVAEGDEGDEEDQQQAPAEGPDEHEQEDQELDEEFEADMARAGGNVKKERSDRSRSRKMKAESASDGPARGVKRARADKDVAEAGEVAVLTCDVCKRSSKVVRVRCGSPPPHLRASVQYTKS
jgi:hypothetical protein